MAYDGKKVSVEPGLIARAIGAMKGFKEGWFGPGDPLPPVVPVVQDAEVRGRQFDFKFSTNRNTTPRVDEAISFQQLRNLADACDVLRIIIERRKDQIAKLEWKISLKDTTKEKATPDPRCEMLTEFFNSPDKEHDWDTWLRMIIEDLIVLDAPAVYLRKNLGNSLYAAEPIDGATLKRVLNEQGRTPIPPLPAYQQILKGLPAINYTTEEIIYKPRNPRTNRVYGFSPVEQIVMTVNIALRRSIHKLQYYTEGNVPEALIGVPDTWTPEQIEAFQENFDAMLSGNTAQRSKAKFIPGGTTPYFTKSDALKDVFDEWLARIVCFAFGIDPTPFVTQVNRATAETARDTALADGMVPLMDWVSSLCNMIILKGFGWADIGFTWNVEEDVDPLIKAQVDKIYLDAGVILPEEVRSDIGRDPFTPEQKAEMEAKRMMAQAAFMGNNQTDEEGGNDEPNKPVGNDKKDSKEPVVVKVELGDTYVDVGATTVNARFDPPQSEVQKATKTSRMVKVHRAEDGSMVGEIVEEGKAPEAIIKSVKVTPNADGTATGQFTSKE